MYIPNLSVVCFFICLSYFVFYCALLLFCAQAWHGKTLSSRNDPISFCSLHWRNLSLYNKITTTHFKQIRFWWKNVITFRGKVYSNFFKFVQQIFFWVHTHTHTHTHTRELICLAVHVNALEEVHMSSLYSLFVFEGNMRWPSVVCTHCNLLQVFLPV